MQNCMPSIHVQGKDLDHAPMNEKSAWIAFARVKAGWKIRTRRYTIVKSILQSFWNDQTFLREFHKHSSKSYKAIFLKNKKIFVATAVLTWAW